MKSPILIPFFECHFPYWVSFSDLNLVLPETEARYLIGYVLIIYNTAELHSRRRVEHSLAIQSLPAFPELLNLGAHGSQFLANFFHFCCKECQVGSKIEQKLKWKLVKNWLKILTVSISIVTS
jgi:hypothetical protein